LVKDDQKMSTVRELHNKAMKLSQLAFIAREKGDIEKAEDLAREAYSFESKAADLIPFEKSSEPTRSIMYLSAASLAFQCKEFHEAQRLVSKGLSGYPSKRIEQELKNLFAQANFEHHLQTKEIEIEEEVLKLSFKGNAVGYGIIPYNEFINRISKMYNLIDRVIQRKSGRIYQQVGRTFNYFTPMVSAPSAGSINITFKLGKSLDKQQPLFFNASDIINEIIKGIELINNFDEIGLMKLIGDESYYNNFIALAKNIAPDGDKINFISFSSKSKSVTFTRSKKDIEIQRKSKLLENAEFVKIEGVLNLAKSKKEDIIGLTADDGKEYELIIEKGMDDLVVSYWKKWVIVTGNYDGKYIYPKEINSGEDSLIF
jgi:hypothetical protein